MRVVTPDTIRSREFLVALRGYDRDEVRAFLSDVADALSELSRDTAGPMSQGSLFAEVGVQTQGILDAAQAAGDEIRRRAQVEADTTVQEAVEEAGREVDRLRELAAATHQHIEMMEQRRDDLAQTLRRARETVDLALLDIEADLIDTQPADPTNSVLAAQAESAPPDEDGAVVPDATVVE